MSLDTNTMNERLTSLKEKGLDDLLNEMYAITDIEYSKEEIDEMKETMRINLCTLDKFDIFEQYLPDIQEIKAMVPNADDQQ